MGAAEATATSRLDRGTALMALVRCCLHTGTAAMCWTLFKLAGAAQGSACRAPDTVHAMSLPNLKVRA